MELADLSEYLFGRVIKYIKKPSDMVQQRTVTLQSIHPRLIILSRALTGKPVDIFSAIKEGGYKGDNFFLPESFSFYNTSALNGAFYLFRIWYLSVQYNLRLNGYGSASLSDSEALRKAAESAPRVLEALFAEYPMLQDIYEQLLAEVNPETGKTIDQSWLYGKWMADSAEKQDILEPGLEDKAATPGKQPKTTIKARPVEEMIHLTIDQKQQEDYVLTHNFEKVVTADEFSGTWRDFDGDDELEDHQDALDELNMKYTVRTDDEAHSVYEAGFTDNARIAESSAQEKAGYCVPYDEWDCYKKSYRKNYSKVYPVLHTATDAAYYRQTILQNRSVLEQLRKMLTSINNKWQQQRLQTQGREVDIDMAVNRFADVYAGCTPSDKVYIADRKKEKDLSILLLLDMSLSSDSYVDGNRVIDIEKQTAILFGEILAEYDVDFSIHGFHSRTRNHLSYITLKAFDEKWNTAKFRTGALQPSGYTRIGPALRHCSTLLRSRESQNKWVILLSDGKPNDYDRYEGRYGIQDVKQALRELNREDIQTYALAVETSARYYLPQMFGQNHYQIVSSNQDLLKALIKLYGKIRYGN